MTRVSRVPINKRVSCGKHFVRNHLTGLWIKVKIRTVDNFQGEEADVSTGMFTEGGTLIIPSGYYTFFGEELRKWSSGVFKHGRTRVCQHRIFQGTLRQSMSVTYFNVIRYQSENRTNGELTVVISSFKSLTFKRCSCCFSSKTWVIHPWQRQRLLIAKQYVGHHHRRT